MVAQDRWKWLAAVVLATASVGCKPEIGDECSVSTDCSNTGDRLCDTTMPGGYCTIFNCEPGTCPEEAICIAFNTSVSKACQDPQDDDRLLRTFCMRSCDEDGDCRGGYACLDMSVDNPWDAKVIEYGSPNSKICVPPYSGPAEPENPNTEVCTGTDAGFDVTPWEPDAGPSGPDAGPDAPEDAPADAADAGTDAADAAGDAELDAGVDAAVDAATDT